MGWRFYCGCKLIDSIDNGIVKLNNVIIDGTITYVINEEGEFIFGKRFNPNNPNKRSPHPTLIGGLDPLVKCARMVTFKKGKIISINHMSGHFKPNIKSMKIAYQSLRKVEEKYPEVFEKFEWR